MSNLFQIKSLLKSSLSAMLKHSGTLFVQGACICHNLLFQRTSCALREQFVCLNKQSACLKEQLVFCMYMQNLLFKVTFYMYKETICVHKGTTCVYKEC